MNKLTKELSKRVSYILRHKPDSVGLTLDEAGWVDVKTFLEKTGISKQDLDDIVANNNKKRFEYSEDGLNIRARQGHSIDVELGYKPLRPPQFLYHGTAIKNIENILADGIKKMNRHHVHLSVDIDTAKTVGSRHGKPVVLRVAALEMYKAGIAFFKTDNDVWLTEFVEPDYCHQIK